jgi:hypothetical protein
MLCLELSVNGKDITNGSWPPQSAGMTWDLQGAMYLTQFDGLSFASPEEVYRSGQQSWEIDAIEGTDGVTSQAVVTPMGVRWIAFTSAADREQLGMVSHCP